MKSATKTLMKNKRSPLSPRHAGESGYTLIEILIVIAIISIVASVATLTIHFNRNKQMESLANDLVNSITLAEEEAMLHPAVLGLAFTPNSYQFFRYQETDKTWQPLGNKAFKAKIIPDKVQVVLKIHDTIIPADGIPKLIISTSGDIPAFIISIGNRDEKPLYQVIGEANGNVYAK